MADVASEFRDPTGRANWARWLLYAEAALSVVAIVSGIMEYSVLNGIKNATFASDADMIAAAEASDTRQMIIGIAQIVVIIAALIVFFMWVYRSASNARSFAPDTMQFTPGWSVGWFFIPIANLWKPYQAVKEIWEVSRGPSTPEDSNLQPLLGWWWFFWLAALVASNASARLNFRAESIDELITANVVTNISDAIDIPSCLLTIAVISRIYKAQMARTAQQAPVIT